VPAVVNPKAKRGQEVLDLVAADPRVELRETSADGFADAVAAEVKAGTPRILISGGDGTIATAARALRGSRTELAIVPGGTLNHFAKDLALPDDPAEALELALSGTARPADAAEVDGQLFLNTSSVGVYVLFVRTRERLERRLPYRLASALAALRLLFTLKAYSVVLDVDGRQARYASPLVFIGVGERELQLPSLGARVEGGRRALHVIVVRGTAWSRIVALGLQATVLGTWAAARTDRMDSFLVERCTIELPRPRGNVALDGEIEPLEAPLEYAYVPDALRVVMPPPPAPKDERKG
jgi:diacylglycerol kinase family enzyme